MSLRRPDVIVAAAALLALLVVLLLLSAPAARAATTLEQGLKRETALLVAEKDALARERERITVNHDARAAVLRAAIATLEDPLVEATAREEALRSAVQARVAAATATVATAPDAGTQATVRAAFAALGGPVPAVPAGAAPAVGLLGEAAARLADRARPQRLDTGFFDADGAWVQGRVVRWGGFFWAAATDPTGAAGAVRPASDGALQLAGADAPSATSARAFVAGDDPRLLPLALGDSDGDDDAGPAVVAGLSTRLSRLGGDGIALVVIACAAFALALLPLLRVLQGHRATAAVAGRLPALVRAGETAAAAALARTVPGVAGAFLQSVVAATTRAHPDDEVAALSVETGFALERAHHAVRVGAVVSAATVILVTARALSVAIAGLLGTADVPTRAVLDALAGALLPVEAGALLAIPWALLLVTASLVVARARERLDVLALRVLDAVDRGVARA